MSTSGGRPGGKSGVHPRRGRRSQLDSVATILDSVLGQRHLAQGIRDYAFFSDWERIVGSALASSTRPLRVQNGILWVQVENATLRQHLTYVVPEMLRKIRIAAPGTTIESIRFTMSAEL